MQHDFKSYTKAGVLRKNASKRSTNNLGSDVKNIEALVPKFIAELKRGDCSLHYAALNAGFRWEYWGRALREQYKEVQDEWDAYKKRQVKRGARCPF